VEALLRRLPDEAARSAALTCSSAAGRKALHLALRGSRPSAASALLAVEGQLAAANVEDLMVSAP
jgi:hypothetical protein